MIRKQKTTDVLASNNNVLYELSDAIKHRRPVLAQILKEHKGLTLEEYALLFKKKSSGLSETLQPREDFINACEEYIERIAGKEVADKIKERLSDNYNILTANHHGPLFCNIQLQGQILFALAEEQNSIMPVFAFGDIPLNNATYPRGIILNGNIKLPLFPDRMKNSLVSFVNSYAEENVVKIIKKAKRLFNSDQLTEDEYETIQKILSDIFLEKGILNRKTYSEQSVLINMKLWNMLISKVPGLLPDIACFEIEKIVSKLLNIDLNNNDSLIFNIFFREELRSCLLDSLNREYGCWDLSKLKEITASENKSSDKNRKHLAGSGTIFFWGIDSKKRRFPLDLIKKNEIWYLVGMSDSLISHKIKFDSHSIIEALQKQYILPSLFTSFCIISFARNYVCFGGFMQADYLTVMKKGLVRSLVQSQLTKQAEVISKISTENYCTGIQFILYKQNGNLYPAGTFNIISHGGLNKKRLNQIKNISLEKADMLGLPVKYPAVYRKTEQQKHLRDLTVNNIYSILEDEDIFLIY